MHPVHIQACRVTASTVSGPTGASSAPGPVLYVAFTQQLRSDLLTPRDREPCLVFDLNGTTLTAGYYICRLAASYTGLPVYEAMARASSGSGITSINDDSTVTQTVGITDVAPGFPGDNELSVYTSAAPAWDAGQLYLLGWVVTYTGKQWRAIIQNENNAPPNGNWTECTGDGINVLSIPKARIYTDDGGFATAGVDPAATPTPIPSGNNFRLEGVGIYVASVASTNRVILTGGATIINVTNIYETTNYVENVIYFNTFNNTVIIKYGDEIFIFYTDCCEGRKYYCMSKDAAQNCYNLTATEYALMLMDGFAYESGPHDTKLECLASCSEVPTAWWCMSLDDVSDCYELTEAELFAMIDDDGYFPESGPHATEEACLAACGGSPVETVCCAELIPATLVMTILSGCDEATTPQVMTYNAAGPDGAGWYTVSENVGGNDLYWVFYCVGPTDWQLIKKCNDDAWTSGESAVLSCSPFDSGEFNMPISGACCSPGVDTIVQITE